MFTHKENLKNQNKPKEYPNSNDRMGRFLRITPRRTCFETTSIWETNAEL